MQAKRLRAFVRITISVLAALVVLPPALADPWDPGDNTEEGATLLPAPTETPAWHGPHTLLCVEGGDSADWFALPLEAGVRYDLSVVDEAGNLARTTEIYVSDLVFGGAAYFTPMCTAIYNFRAFQLMMCTEYYFRYSIADPPPEFLDPWDAHDDVPGGATELTPPERAWQEHGPHTREGTDWFKIPLRAGETVVFHTPEDRCGRLYTAAEALSGCEADLPRFTPMFLWYPSFGATLEYTPVEDGWHYVRLTDNCYSGRSIDEPYTLRYRAAPRHDADQDGDGRIALGELLRVIQFFNALGYHCAASPGASEDGYAAGPGADTACPAHASDYDGGADWTISLGELLRLIQFFNAGGVHACPFEETEDGYCPGPP